MKIAVNTRFAWYGYEEGYGRFTRELCRRLPVEGVHDDFMYIHDCRHKDVLSPAQNVSEQYIGPPARHPLLWKYWYDIRIPSLLRRQQAGVFFSPDGICSLHTSVPQVVAIHDLAFLHYPSFLPWVQYQFYKKYTPLFIQKASRVITVSEFSRKDIHHHYPFSLGKVEVVHNAADDAFRPMEWHDRNAFRALNTEGREYFLCVGSIHPRKNLMNLLKAFAVFKRRQKSNMLLVIAGRKAWKNDDFDDALKRFRFRQDVRMLGYVPADQMPALMASAYALVYPSLWEGFGIPLLEAMQSGVPVLCAGNTSMPEVAGDAGLYFDPLEPEEIGHQMATIYKDETLRNQMIAAGLHRSGLFSWDLSAKKIYDILFDAAQVGNP